MTNSSPAAANSKRRKKAQLGIAVPFARSSRAHASADSTSRPDHTPVSHVTIAIAAVEITPPIALSQIEDFHMFRRICFTATSERDRGNDDFTFPRAFISLFSRQRALTCYRVFGWI